MTKEELIAKFHEYKALWRVAGPWEYAERPSYNWTRSTHDRELVAFVNGHGNKFTGIIYPNKTSPHKVKITASTEQETKDLVDSLLMQQGFTLIDELEQE